MCGASATCRACNVYCARVIRGGTSGGAVGARVSAAPRSLINWRRARAFVFVRLRLCACARECLFLWRRASCMCARHLLQHTAGARPAPVQTPCVRGRKCSPATRFRPAAHRYVSPPCNTHAPASTCVGTSRPSSRCLRQRINDYAGSGTDCSYYYCNILIRGYFSPSFVF